MKTLMAKFTSVFAAFVVVVSINSSTVGSDFNLGTASSRMQVREYSEAATAVKGTRLNAQPLSAGPFRKIKKRRTKKGGNMQSRTLKRRIVLALSLGITLTMMPPYFSATGSTKRLNTTPQLPVAHDVIVEWNQQAVTMTLTAVPALAPVEQTRKMAIFQLAVHDAVNGITGEYETYLSPPPAPGNASPFAAAIAAANHSLKLLFPGNDSLLDGLAVGSFVLNGLSPTDPGVEYGRATATAIFAARIDDNSAQARFDYRAPGEGDPGVWVRPANVAALLPGWGRVTPFVLRTSSQFRPEPPPALDSEKYVNDYNEVKAIGKDIGSTRSTPQSEIARFWRGSPTAIWNPVLVQLVQSRDIALSKRAQLFALFYLAAADASIACWEAKYTYNFWRPETAIRNGDFDLNDLTFGDGAWSSFITPTPPHPEYPSGHTANSSAMAKILTLAFEDDPGMTLVVTLSGITRSWTTFSQAIDEVIDARVYSGIHFRNSDEVGARMGSQVAKFVSTHALRPSRTNH